MKMIQKHPTAFVCWLIAWALALWVFVVDGKFVSVLVANMSVVPYFVMQPKVCEAKKQKWFTGAAWVIAMLVAIVIVLNFDSLGIWMERRWFSGIFMGLLFFAQIVRFPRWSRIYSDPDPKLRWGP